MANKNVKGFKTFQDLYTFLGYERASEIEKVTGVEYATLYRWFKLAKQSTEELPPKDVQKVDSFRASMIYAAWYKKHGNVTIKKSVEILNSHCTDCSCGEHKQD